jgi:peroxiredoxin
MKRGRVLAGLALLAVTGVVAWQSTGQAAGDPAGATVGQPAPDFKLKDVYGKEFTLGEMKGHVVVLEWTNYECPFVVGHHKDKQTTQKLYAQYAGKGVIWLAIDSTHGRKAEGDRNWAAVHRLAYPILLDPTGAVGRAYGAKTTPHMFVIDREGVLAYAGAIDDMKDHNYVAAALDAVLEGKKPEKTETKSYGCSVKYGKQAAVPPVKIDKSPDASLTAGAGGCCPAVANGGSGCPFAGKSQADGGCLRGQATDDRASGGCPASVAEK